MARKKVVETPDYVENIQNESLDFVMGDRYAVYAKYVIQDRAIPDARDGLKPVQRRIIYSMYRNGNTFDKPNRKCATIVGAVMGKLHPHGDRSIYEALVRMSQSWKMSMPLISFQGNNGSIDNDGPAAYRYTEAKLNEFAMNLVRDIDKETVDMTLNFDDTELEPVVLPARFPNLFVNGSEGIAVAIATEIPPHNLNEIIDATIYRINNPSCRIDELLEIVKGPDFPTGGIIYESEGLKDIYYYGKGKIDVAAKVEIKEEKDANFLVITEIPYKVVKQDLVFSIDRIRKNKDIDGIVEVLDESANEDIKIVVELKKDVDPNIVLTYLYNKTQLKVHFSANVVAISHNHPKTLNLISYLDTYIDHQIDVTTRKLKYDLKVSEARLHIVEGLIKAVSIIEQVVETIRHSKDKADSKNNLITKFGFSEIQAEAIVMMHLYRLSNTDITTYYNERDNLVKNITYLKDVLSNDKKLRKLIISDLTSIKEKYGVPRRTLITSEINEVTIEKRDLIAKEDVYVVITKEGYAKRTSLKSYKASNGAPTKVKEGDSIVLQTVVNTIDYILGFTNKGNYLFIPVHELSDIKWKDEGKHINSFITLPVDEMIIKCVVVKDFNKNVSIALVSKKGQIKKTLLKEFYAQRYTKPISCMRLLKDDSVADVCVCNGNSNLFILTKNGTATYFNENELSNLGLKTSGVKAISTLKNNSIEALFSYKQGEKGKLLLLTREGMYRVFDISNLELTQRLGKTQVVFKSFKSDPHSLLFATKLLNKNDPVNLKALMSDNSIIDFEITDLYLTPIVKMCRKNLEFSDDLTIKSIFITDVQSIDENTVEEEAPLKEEDNNNQKDDEPEFQQISIFDDID